MKITLDHKEPLAGDVVSFVFDAPDDFIWTPGQFTHVTLPHDNPDDRGIERWFTIAAAPYEKQPRITTRIFDKPSSFKRALNDLKPGDTLEADLPEGEFVLDNAGQRYVFIAGGIGFTPFHAILAQADHDGVMPDIRVLYGVRDNSPVFKDELDRLSAKYASLRVQYIVEPERINEEVIRGAVPDLKLPIFYISGPEPMVKAFDTMLETMGVPKPNRRRDSFPGYVW